MFKRKESAAEVKPEPKKKKKKKKRLRKLLLLGVVGGGAALAYSKDLRSKLLDKLFGSEKEFNYSAPAGDSGQTPDA